MPSGATSLQLHAKYAPVNRGSIRYGASRSHGHHTSPKTWSQETGIDLDRLIHDEREYITRMRRRTRRDIDVKPCIQRVYETTVALQMEGVTPSSHKVASRLNIPRSTVMGDVHRLAGMGLLVNARTRRGGFLATGRTPDWSDLD